MYEEWEKELNRIFGDEEVEWHPLDLTDEEREMYNRFIKALYESRIAPKFAATILAKI